MNMFVPILLLVVGFWLTLVWALAEPNSNFASKILFKVVPVLLSFTCFITAAELFGWVGGG